MTETQEQLHVSIEGLSYRLKRVFFSVTSAAGATRACFLVFNDGISSALRLADSCADCVP